MKGNPLEGKTVIVTGASSGIGKEIARSFAQKGAKIALVARRPNVLETAAKEIRSQGGSALAVPADVTNRQQVFAAVNKVLDEWGQIDILVVNAGAYVRSPIRELKVDHLEESMAVNFYGGVHFILDVLPDMRKRGRGHLIIITSMDAKKGLPMDAPYVAAKFAMSGLAEVMRQELKDEGIKVTTIFPGRVDTPLIDNLEVPWISAKIKPEKVAAAVVRVTEHYKPEVILPKQAGLLYYLNVVSPRLGDFLVKSFRLEGWYTSKKESPVR